MLWAVSYTHLDVYKRQMLSLGMLTINALAASDSVIVPVQAHYLLLKGMTQLMQTIEKVQRQINPPLKVDGILPVSYTHLDVYKRQELRGEKSGIVMETYTDRPGIQI